MQEAPSGWLSHDAQRHRMARSGFEYTQKHSMSQGMSQFPLATNISKGALPKGMSQGMSSFERYTSQGLEVIPTNATQLQTPSPT